MEHSFDIVMPSENQEGTKSILGRWLKQIGESVEQHEPLIEITTDKVTLEIAAPHSGVLSEILKQPNEDVAPGEVLGRISNAAVKTNGKASKGAPASAKPHSAKPQSKLSSSSQQDLSPAVKQFVSEHGLDITQIHGSGSGGRITYDDVVRHKAGSPTPSFAPPPQARDSTITARKSPHTAMRKMIAGHMVSSLLHTAPHVTSLFEADFSKALSHRAQNKAAFEAQGVRLTLTSYLVRAASMALCAVPEVNSRWHDDYLEIFEDCNIGIATAIEGRAAEGAGLIVPVLHRAQTFGLFEIAKKLQELTEKGRNNSLQPQEVQGGTFTISNHGTSGSLLATPIVINQPQSAILGVGKLEKRVVVRSTDGNDSMQILPMAYVTLTIDHRVLDGFTANKFLTVFTETLEKGAF